MRVDLIIYNINKLYTSLEKPPVKGHKMRNIHVLSNAYVAIKSGKIFEIGEGDFSHLTFDQADLYDTKGMVCLPGLIDSHSHLVHAGSREHEFSKLRQGIPYLDILNAGGGILGTVEKTRQASFQDLYDQAYKSLDVMLSHGVTTLESKSGYGLELSHELKQLNVSNKLNQDHPIHIVSTYMGAHALPKAYKDDRKAYINQIKLDLKDIKASNLTQSVDVFCETGVFDLEETRDILETAKSLGFSVKLHADEIDSLGGAGLGVDLNATSVDHLMAMKEEDMIKLSQSNTVGNLLPGTSFYLNKAYANARKMLDYGCALAISGDYNPGSCPTENFQLIMQLAANYLLMTPEEILTATTLNAAYHLGLSNTKGSLSQQKDADLILLNIPNLDYMFYHFGINHVSDVMIQGKFVVKNKMILKESL